MKKITIQEWLDALKSGKYKRGKGRLRTTDNHYCCLGVLCDLVDDKGWELKNNRWYWIDKRNNIPRDVTIDIGIYLPYDYLHISTLKLTELNDYTRLDDYTDVVKYLEAQTQRVENA